VKSKYIYYIFFAISLLWSCTPQHSYTIKSFLFDGVPNPYAEETVLQDSTLSVENQTTNQALSSLEAKSRFELHPPYQSRDCSKCHDRDQMGKLKLPTPDLCNLCHKDFNKQYTLVHGPVVTGSCAECHKPHQSKLKKLLTLPDQELCIKCHDTHLSRKNEIHQDLEGVSCLSCHNPHGGENRFLLESRACYRCHENYEDKYEILHGPVDALTCAVCHETHESSKEKHLIKEAQELCLDCHVFKDILSSTEHQSTEKNCLECHDPHGGSNRKFLLNTSTK